MSSALHFGFLSAGALEMQAGGSADGVSPDLMQRIEAVIVGDMVGRRDFRARAGRFEALKWPGSRRDQMWLRNVELVSPAVRRRSASCLRLFSGITRDVDSRS
jgi:hypothetical protein